MHKLCVGSAKQAHRLILTADAVGRSEVGPLELTDAIGRLLYLVDLAFERHGVFPRYAPDYVPNESQLH